MVLGVLWGLNWPAVKIALGGVTPWTLRGVGLGAGAATLFIVAVLRGRSLAVLAIPPGPMRLHLLVGGLLSVAAFNLLVTFAQLGAATSRVAIVTFSMPLWTALFVRIALGERLDRRSGMALASGAVGLAVLLYPLVAAGGALPPGMRYALGAAIAWASGTVYMKWARVAAEPLVVAAWQLLVGAIVAGIGVAWFDGFPRLATFTGLTKPVMLALAYHALFGIALAYLLWFEVIARLPAGVATLGTLLVPVVGVSSAVLLLGDRPSGTDLVGFALVLGAAACVLSPRSPTKPGGAA